jgi:hypothetical protein
MATSWSVYLTERSKEKDTGMVRWEEWTTRGNNCSVGQLVGVRLAGGASNV